MASSANLYSRLQSARSEHDRLQHDYQSRHSLLQQTQATMATTLQQIRTVIIEAIRAGERFDWTDTDEQVSALFKQLYARNDVLAEQLRRDEQEASAANEVVRTAVAQHEQAAQALAHLDQHIDSATDQVAEVQSTRAHIDEIELLTERLNNQKADAESEATEKRQAYESDRYFRYLWKRGYGSDRYQASMVTTRFDRWLAENCYYSDNARQYELLLAIPVRLQAAITESTGQIETLESVIAEHRETIATQMQRPIAQKTVDDAATAVSKAKAQVTQIMQRIDAAKKEAGAIQTGQHGLHQNMASLVDGAMGNRDLARFVNATLTTTDDQLLQRYEVEYRKQQQLQADLSSLRTTQQTLQNEVSELDSAYRRAQAVEAALIAAATARRSRPRHSGGGMWGGGGGGFGGGGFSGGGGFGGGGFKTGGGF